MQKLAPVLKTLDLAEEFRARPDAWRHFDAFVDRWTTRSPREGKLDLLDHVCAWVCCARSRNRAEIELLATSSPAHAHAARHARRRAPAVGRLLVESARFLGLEKPAAALEALTEAIVLLRSPAAEEALGDVRRDLIWLARAGLAEARHRWGKSGVADKALDKIALDAVGDPEIRAAILEIRAELWRRQKRGAHALVLYDQILVLLDDAAGRETRRERVRLLDQRRAEARLRQGAVLLQLELFDGAATTLRQANELLHVGPPDRLRHDILHLLAVARIKNGQHAAARRHLAHAIAIAEQIPVPARLAAGHRWLGGLLAARDGRYPEAAEALLDAARRFNELERSVDGTRVLLDLLAVIGVHHDGEIVAQAIELSTNISTSPEAQRYLAVRLGRVRERLRARKLLVPAVRRLIDDLFEAARAAER